MCVALGRAAADLGHLSREVGDVSLVSGHVHVNKRDKGHMILQVGGHVHTYFHWLLVTLPTYLCSGGIEDKRPCTYDVVRVYT